VTNNAPSQPKLVSPKSWHTWINGQGKLVVRAEVSSQVAGAPPDERVLSFSCGTCELAIHGQTAASIEKLGLDLLHLAEGLRVADPAYTPTLGEAMRHPNEFVDSMTETSGLVISEMPGALGVQVADEPPPF